MIMAKRNDTADFRNSVREAVVDSVRQAAESAGQDADLAAIRRAVEADMAGAGESGWGRH
jgi:hypothetical protein